MSPDTNGGYIPDQKFQGRELRRLMHERATEHKLEPGDIGQAWNIVSGSQGWDAIPGAFNTTHHSVALGLSWKLPDGIRPAWRSKEDYLGPVLHAETREALLAAVSKPFTRIPNALLRKG